MTLTRMWKRVIAQGVSLSFFGLVITFSAEEVPAGMPADLLACDEAEAATLVVDDTVVADTRADRGTDIVIRVPSRPANGWRALVPGMKLPRT